MSDNNHVSLRPICADDVPFLASLYATTREDIAALPLPEDQIEALMQHQFQAQHDHYQRYFPDADFDVILYQDTAVGRIYVDRTDDEIRLIDIAVLPASRGQGIGSQLMTQIIDEARGAGKPLRLRVHPESQARLWYERLGFVMIADEQVNLHMELLHE